MSSPPNHHSTEVYCLQSDRLQRAQSWGVTCHSVWGSPCSRVTRCSSRWQLMGLCGCTPFCMGEMLLEDKSLHRGDGDSDLRYVFSQREVDHVLACACWPPFTRSWAVTATWNEATQADIASSPSSVRPAVETVGHCPDRILANKSLIQTPLQWQLTKSACLCPF